MNLFQHLPFRTVRKDVTPEGRDGRKELDSAQSIRAEKYLDGFFHITVQVDEDFLHLFDLQCFCTPSDTERIAYVGFQHLQETVAGPSEASGPPITGALRKIVHGVQVCAAMGQFQLISTKVNATVTGPLVKWGP